MQTDVNSKARKSKKAPRPTASSHGECCKAKELQHPNHAEYLPRLNRISGQIAGIEKMISEQRYCVDILVQFRAVMAALRSIEVSVFETHLNHCVSTALLSKDKKEVETKIRELTELLSRRTSL